MCERDWLKPTHCERIDVFLIVVGVPVVPPRHEEDRDLSNRLPPPSSNND